MAPTRNTRPRVFIDGDSGTTGLQLRRLLEQRADLELLTIDPDLRKDPGARAARFSQSDLVILCLPDAAAIEAVEAICSERTRILDASTAHRVRAGWTYGLPELAPGQREAIREARRVANPGCYPTGIILLLRPLIDADLLSPEAPIAVHALSGYSGGGKALIERWESPSTGLLDLPFDAPYQLDGTHKHLPEITRYAGLSRPPHFVPAVGPFRQGMRILIALNQALLIPGATEGDVHAVLSERYRGESFVTVRPRGLGAELELELDPRKCNGTNRIELAVIGNPLGHLLLVAILDNLGKGAAGAAVQNLNLMLDLEESLGLPAAAPAR